MDARSSSTQLPPVRRTKRRDWVRLACRSLCVILAFIGVVPIGVGMLLRTSWARDIATRETRSLLTKFGVDATYDLQVRLWPLSVSLEDVTVQASDGGSPFLTAKGATARPKIFGLLAGKLTIDQIEIDQPKARVVLSQGKIQNLKLDLPESKEKERSSKAPFSVVSVSDAEVDLTVDDSRVVAREIDADVTAEADGEGGSAFEVALRVGEAKTKLVRTLAPATATEGAKLAVDDDTLCGLDGRAR
ncbi:MAG TPA: hypothetical protein VM580_01555, partial [Labilithrix sp.]|nr:hypothetical protein [Labilithrix sp.]